MDVLTWETGVSAPVSEDEIAGLETFSGAQTGSYHDRPALDEAHIRMRPGGRQVVIDTGGKPDCDDLDVHPDREKHTATEVIPPTPQGDEQKITGFSEDARRRLRDRIHAMKRDAGGVFITLTYHETDPSPETAKDDLDRFWKRLERRFPGASAIWKMEPQERGVPHFHLLIYGPTFIPAQWLSEMWHDVTEETTDKHKKSGVDVEPYVNGDGKIQAYLSKYMDEEYDRWPGAKPGDEWAETGRWWGCLSRKNLPWAEWERAAVYLDETEAMRLISELLDEWDVDIPNGVVPPSLTINTRGDPAGRMESLLARL